WDKGRRSTATCPDSRRPTATCPRRAMAVAKNKAQQTSARQMSEGTGDNGANERTGAAVADLGKERELAAYHDMLLIRRFEEKAGQMYGMGLIGGFCHLYIGQEAVVVGMQMALKEGDAIITGYRDHGH